MIVAPPTVVSVIEDALTPFSAPVWDLRAGPARRR